MVAKDEDYTDALTHGNLTGPWVDVKQSLICKTKGQIGVFATVDFTEDVPITWYTSYYKSPGKVGRNNAFLMDAPAGVQSANVGVRRLKNLAGRGVAQLANDALCSRLTKMDNNCDFIEYDRRMYLVARRNIARGEELLVHYGWGYWEESRCKQMSDEFQRVLHQHRTLAAALESKYGLRVGNCVHSADDENNQRPFDITSFDIPGPLTCPATGVLHQKPMFRMRHDKVTEDGTVVWSSETGNNETESMNLQMVPVHLDYTYVCTICAQACTAPFVRFVHE